jgi:NAD(P)H-hydrate repair Nnr-like enzyme with NAD(P)H-hydrate dehydratase domain
LDKDHPGRSGKTRMKTYSQLSEREVLAGTPATEVEEEVATRGGTNDAPAVVDPDPTAMVEPRLGPTTEPATPVVTPNEAEVEAVAETLQEIKAPPKKFRKKQVVVRKMQP